MTRKVSKGEWKTPDKVGDLVPLLMERAERIHRYCTRRIRPSLQGRVAAEDVLQEVWITACRNISSAGITSEEEFDRWLARTADRKLIDAIRMARRVKRGGKEQFAGQPIHDSSSYLNLFSRVAAKGRTPSSENAAFEAVHAVQIALGTMPDDYRQAITLYHLEGRSREEVASRMTRTGSAIASLLYRARLMLRERLGLESRYFSDHR